MFKFLIKSFNGLFTAYQNTHALTSSLSWAGFLRKPGSVGCAAASLPSSLGLSSSGFMAGQRHFCGKIMTVSQHCGCKKLEQLQEEPSHRHKKASSGAGPQPADKSAEASRRVDHGFSELLDFFQILFLFYFFILCCLLVLWYSLWCSVGKALAGFGVSREGAGQLPAALPLGWPSAQAAKPQEGGCSQGPSTASLYMCLLLFNYGRTGWKVSTQCGMVLLALIFVIFPSGYRFSKYNCCLLLVV